MAGATLLGHRIICLIFKSLANLICFICRLHFESLIESLRWEILDKLVKESMQQELLKVLLTL